MKNFPRVIFPSCKQCIRKSTSVQAASNSSKVRRAFLFYFMYIISNECKYLLAMKFLRIYIWIESFFNMACVLYGNAFGECLVCRYKLTQQWLKLLKTFYFLYIVYVPQLLRVYKNGNLWFMIFSLWHCMLYCWAAKEGGDSTLDFHFLLYYYALC